jgi:hypothetical protein
MAKRTSDRPVIDPILSLISKPRKESVTGGGKSRESIRADRLAAQRQALSKAMDKISRVSPDKTVLGHVPLVVKMFKDSTAPTYAPTDLFWSGHGANLISPFKEGYLAEIQISKIPSFIELIESTNKVKHLVDISRVSAIDILDGDHVLGGQDPKELMRKAAKINHNGKELSEFMVWFSPFSTAKMRTEAVNEAAKSLRIKGLEPRAIKDAKGKDYESKIIETPDERSLVTLTPPAGNKLPAFAAIRLAAPIYAVALESPEQLSALAASGKVVRIDPIGSIISAHADVDEEEVVDLTNMGLYPIVGIVDGGRTAKIYDQAEAWRINPDLVHISIADTPHGNRVSSIAVHGHQLNKELKLPKLNCRIGTCQVLTRPGLGHKAPHPKVLIQHLNQAILDNPETKVWNFSANTAEECDLFKVSALGHAITNLARQHKILPIISAGNKSETEILRIAPPADCEAGLVVAGRQANDKGEVHNACSKSRIGLGPDEMLKPDVSWFSTVKVNGGNTVNGTSYAAPLVASLAAHTWQKLKNPTPDLVKALLVNNCDLTKYDQQLGWGSPVEVEHPWECEPGTVCIAWSSKLKAGLEHYWDDIAIPPSMFDKNFLKGKISLTAILDPGYLNFVGLGNYCMTRLEVALQDAGMHEDDESSNVLGSMNKKLKEYQARKIDHKWSPVRRHTGSFRKRALSSNKLRLRARIYARDLWQLGLHMSALPELDVAFVLKFQSPNNDPSTYSAFVQAMHSQVQSAIIDQSIEIDANN